jgi:glycolate oxidase
MNYNIITPPVIDAIITIVGADGVIVQHDELEKYSHDETEDLVYYPEVVAKPQTPEQVAALLKLCNKHRVPVTPRGAVTCLSGGSLHENVVLLIAM